MFKAAFEQSTELGDYLKNSAESDIAKYIKATEEMSGTLGELDLSLITSNDAMRGYLGTIENGAIPSMEGFKTYCKESGLALKEMTLAQNAAAIGARALSVAMNTRGRFVHCRRPGDLRVKFSNLLQCRFLSLLPF